MSNKAEKLLERARANKTGWNRHDLDALYRGFGFVIESRTNHDLVHHPDYPQLYSYLPRHTRIREYLVVYAVKRINELKELQSSLENVDE